MPPRGQAANSPARVSAGDIITPHRIFHDPDILDRILIFVREDSTTSEFLPLLLVCGPIYVTAIRIFHRIIVLTNETLPRFIACGHIRRHMPYEVLNLTVRLEASDGDFAGFVSNIGYLLEQLGLIVSAFMRRIETFSFRLEERQLEGRLTDPECVAVQPCIKSGPIITLLNVLPATCVNLELDTSLYEMHEEPNIHFCAAISKIIGRLRHLRLRVKHLCPSFLGLSLRCNALDISRYGPVAPNLESIVINLECPSWIYTEAESCPLSRNKFCPIISLHVALGQFLLECHHNKGHLPKIKKLEVYAGTPPMPPSNRWCLRKSDVLRVITRLHFYVPLPSCRLDAPRPSSWRVIRTHDGRDIIGPFGQAREILENSWHSTVFGSRFPLGKDKQWDILEHYPGGPRIEPNWEPLPCERSLDTFVRRQKRTRRDRDPEKRILEGTNFKDLSCTSFRTLREIPDDWLPDLLLDNWDRRPGL